MKPKEVRRLLDSLKEHLEVGKCTRCECLQGALMQVRLDNPGLKKEIDGLISPGTHACLGCEPCPPAQIWEGYLKRK